MWLNALAILALFAGFFLLNRYIESWVTRIGFRQGVSTVRVFYVVSITGILLASGLLFDFNYNNFGIIVSSIFAVVGIALFAQWSILSNITASIIIFFLFPYRVGDRIRINDDEEIKGRISDITLFHLILEMDDGGKLTFPTSVAFQKAIYIENRKISNQTRDHQ